MLHKIIALMFFVFAALQYNDPDYFIWVPIYLVVSVVAIVFDRGWRNSKILLLICGLYLIGMFLYTPDVISWIQNGTPSITGSMKAESQFIEFVREFFGLAICLFVLVYYWRKSLPLPENIASEQ